MAVVAAFLYLRYATYEYQIQASIKLKSQEDSESLKKLQAVQDYGLFTQGNSKIPDEIEILKSTGLITEVADELDLNIQYLSEGKINSSEIYTNPPVNLSFFENDSIINQVDTTFTLQIKSDTEFVFVNDDEKSSNIIYEFGSKINTSFGGLVITPAFEKRKLDVGDILTIKMRSLFKKVESLKMRIGITAAGDNSSILKLTLKDPVKDKGIAILNTLIAKYNQGVIDDKMAVTKSTNDFINDRLQVVSAELLLVDQTAENIQKNNRLTDLAAQSSLYLRSEQETTAKLNETNTQLQLVEQMSSYLEEKSGNGELIPSNIGISDNTYNATSLKINELVQQRNRILKNSTEKNPTIVNLDSQISDLKRSLNQSLENIRTSSEIRLNALTEEDRRLGGKIYSAPKKQRQSRDLTRQQNIKESLYLYLLEKREESAIALGITTPNAKIIDAAYGSSAPVNPKKSITLLAALILGILIPVAIIYLFDLFNTKIKSKYDISRVVDAPFLGDIPKSKKKNVLVKQVDYSPKAEAFRLIRTNIDLC